METAVSVERHPVFDFGLILIFAVLLLDSAQSRVFFHKHDSENSCRCLMISGGIAGDTVALHNKLAVDVTPHMLFLKIHFQVGSADTVVLGLIIVRRDIVGRLAGLFFPGCKILYQQVVLRDLIDHIAVIAAGDGDRAACCGIELPVCSDRIAVVGQQFHKFPELLIPGLIVLDQHSLFVPDQPVLHHIRIQFQLSLVGKHIGDTGTHYIVEVLASGHEACVVCLQLGLFVGSRDLFGINLLLISGRGISRARSQLNRIYGAAGVIGNNFKCAVRGLISIHEHDVGVCRGLHVLFLQFRKR